MRVKVIVRHPGFLSILAMLTSVGSLSEAQFLQRFEMMRKCPNSYYVTVIEDEKKGEVIGCATLQVEMKFIHEAGLKWIYIGMVLHVNM